ncbi:MAG: hypothetical protein QOD55_443 [Solirubrobacteraceae bacterium]|nr:hypothetical protein [Solirubrobacteraceae bacterium]
MLSVLLLVAMVACAAAMVAEQVRQHRRRSRERAALLDPATAVLDDADRQVDATHLPSLSGRYRGWEARLDLLVDTLMLRRLPRLWLRAEVRRSLPVGGPLYVVRQACTAQALEAGGRLTRELVAPADWPEGLVVRTDPERPFHLPGALAPVGRLFDAEEIVSVLVSPRGVRVAAEAARGEAAAFRVSRDARFQAPVAPELAARLLGVTADLAEALHRAPSGDSAGPARAADPPA